MEIKNNFGFWCKHCNEVRYVQNYTYKTTDEFYIWKVKCPVCKKRLTFKEKSIMAYIKESKGK